jgi:hypothetical protein
MTTKSKRKVHKRKTHKKRNVAKGRTQTLREQVAKSRTSSVRRLRSQGFSRSAKSYKKSSPSSQNQFESLGVKEVRINTPENQIYEYYLASSEKDWKLADKVKGIHKCKKHPHKRDDFPCKMKRTVFNNKKEFEEYEMMKDMRNESTNFKTKREHYDDIDTILQLKGDELYRIDNSP